MTSKPLYIIGFMIAIAAVFGGGVSAIYLGSAGILERNAAFLRQRSLVRVFGLGDPETLSKEDIAALVAEHVEDGGTRTDPLTGRTFTLINAYDDADKRKLKARGFTFEGLGFWAPIKGILALTPDSGTTLGIVILEQSETPGLGGRIEEPVFTRQFREGIVVAPNPGGPCIRLLSPGSRDPEGRGLDAITGATQTSMAMAKLLNDNLEAYHRALAENANAKR